MENIETDMDPIDAEISKWSTDDIVSRARLLDNEIRFGQFARYISRSIPTMGPRTERMTTSLNTLSPHHLELINESYMHSVPKDAETHFKVVIVSKEFEGISIIKRHQKVQGLLKEELDSGLHALSIIAKTPEEWSKSDKVEASPKCMGGFGK